MPISIPSAMDVASVSTASHSLPPKTLIHTASIELETSHTGPKDSHSPGLPVFEVTPIGGEGSFSFHPFITFASNYTLDANPTPAYEVIPYSSREYLTQRCGYQYWTAQTIFCQHISSSPSCIIILVPKEKIEQSNDPSLELLQDLYPTHSTNSMVELFKSNFNIFVHITCQPQTTCVVTTLKKKTNWGQLKNQFLADVVGET
ncbi:hypothetical protein BDQ17DRAFT_1432077 [Cyathus striatus]|nr:hypothetical protein BDQ17DRAFT_1432077 [Cyathus striatus]